MVGFRTTIYEKTTIWNTILPSTSYEIKRGKLIFEKNDLSLSMVRSKIESVR